MALRDLGQTTTSLCLSFPIHKMHNDGSESDAVGPGQGWVSKLGCAASENHTLTLETSTQNRI